MKEWKPWETYDQDAEVLPIPEPPCKECRYWKPQRQYIKSTYRKIGMVCDGIICCHAFEMFSDFSCFKLREEKQQD